MRQLPLLLLLLLLATRTAADGGGSGQQQDAFLRYSSFNGKPINVSYDKRSLLLDGQRSMFASVGLHYPRFSPGQWDDVLLKARNDGFNTVQTYYFWNAHVPKLGSGTYLEDGWRNLTAFLEKCAAADMFVDLRIGPYVCAEWSWGGYPYDLAQVDGLQTRTHNVVWESHMRSIVTDVVRRYRSFFADRGGPIILGQIENELHIGDSQNDGFQFQKYVDFCGQLADDSGVDIAWGMCNGAVSAKYGNKGRGMINTKNGGNPAGFLATAGQNGRVLIDQPALWTEDWQGWFDSWGGTKSGLAAGDWDNPSVGHQQAVSQSLSVMQWFARGGSHLNFYNWAGGNQFARNEGGSITNAYYWKAELASDNLAQGPEREHIAKAFAALRQVSSTVLAMDAQVNASKPCVGQPPAEKSGCSSFVYSANGHTVEFREASVAYGPSGHPYGPVVSTLSMDGELLFNSSDVVDNGHGSHVWTRQTAKLEWSAWQDPAIVNTPAQLAPPSPSGYHTWHGSALGRIAMSSVPLEQVNFTEYDSELLIYSREIKRAELAAAVGHSNSPYNGATIDPKVVPLTLLSGVGNAYTVFLNGKKAAVGWESGHHGGTVLLGRDDVSRSNCPYLHQEANDSVVPAADCPANMTLDLSAYLLEDKMKDSGEVGETLLLTLLSTSLGITNGGGINNTAVQNTSSGVKGIVTAEVRPPAVAGRTGAVVLGHADLTVGEWHHRSGSLGEALEVYTDAGAAKHANFVPLGPSLAVPTPPMTWLRTTFDAPVAVMRPAAGVELTSVLNLDVLGLSRGFFWVNGLNLGRYWSKSCGAACPHPPCASGAAPVPCQRYYSIPYDYLKARGNVLTVLDEMGATNLSKTGLAVSSIAPSRLSANAL